MWLEFQERPAISGPICRLFDGGALGSTGQLNYKNLLGSPNFTSF